MTDNGYDVIKNAIRENPRILKAEFNEQVIKDEDISKIIIKDTELSRSRNI